MIKLSTLVETLPKEVFLTPTGILFVSHGPTVNDYNKRLVRNSRQQIPCHTDWYKCKQ